jgi:hypothetical protein
MAILDRTAIARRTGLAAAPPATRPRPERAHAGIGRPACDPAATPGGTALAGAPLARGTGFLIHQLLAAMPELRGPPPDLPRTLGAYRTHLASRIHYSGPVMPVDLRV